MGSLKPASTPSRTVSAITAASAPLWCPRTMPGRTSKRLYLNARHIAVDGIGYHDQRVAAQLRRRRTAACSRRAPCAKTHCIRRVASRPPPDVAQTETLRDKPEADAFPPNVWPFWRGCDRAVGRYRLAGAGRHRAPVSSLPIRISPASHPSPPAMRAGRSRQRRTDASRHRSSTRGHARGHHGSGTIRW